MRVRLGTRVALEHCADEPGQTRIMGSPVHDPTRPTQEPASAPPVQPSVTTELGVQVYVWARIQLHSLLGPSASSVPLQTWVRLVLDPVSGVPVSRTPESTAHAVALRTQPPKTLHDEVTLGPLAVPRWQAPSSVHQPQAGLLVQAPHDPTAAQLAGHAPQSLEQLEQVSAPLQVPSPQTGAHAPQSREQVEQLSVLAQAPSPQTAGQAPQSVGQVVQFSVLAQVRSPQVGEQAPQSVGQVMQFSAPLQRASPHIGGVPTSTGWPRSVGGTPTSTGGTPRSTGTLPLSVGVTPSSVGATG